MSESNRSRFERAAESQGETPLIVELWLFLRHNKRWWMTPIIVVLLLFAVLVFLSGTAAAPFIYTLF